MINLYACKSKRGEPRPRFERERRAPFDGEHAAPRCGRGARSHNRSPCRSPGAPRPRARRAPRSSRRASRAASEVCPQPIGSAMSRAAISAYRCGRNSERGRELHRAEQRQVADSSRAHAQKELGPLLRLFRRAAAVHRRFRSLSGEGGGVAHRLSASSVRSSFSGVIETFLAAKASRSLPSAGCEAGRWNISQ